MRWLLPLCVLALMALPFRAAQAHELRPAYLELRESAPDSFDVLWKVPALGEMRLGLYVRLPSGCHNIKDPRQQISGGAYVEQWAVACEGGLKGKDISVDGLPATMTDVLVRIEYENGGKEIARLRPDAPFATIKGSQGSLEIAGTYFRLGVEHIFSGLDHLLFVLALILLIGERAMLVKTITAFTVAHSITLAGAALGYFSLPQKPVEATIALSIAFVASELIKMKPGERRLSQAYPWVVAFSFGLLHGFGFAGALTQIGLPQTDVPLALLTFNLGVEAGQLIFVAAVLLAMYAVNALVTVPRAQARLAAAYFIGTVATTWFIERVLAFAGA